MLSSGICSGVQAKRRFSTFPELASASYNALAIAIGERETEVATLQANGVGRSWIRRTITAENLVTVAIALVPGLIVGRFIADVFYGQFTTEQITFDALLRPISWIAAIVLIALCAVIAQVPGLRRLDHLDLPTKVRERAL
jgi:ABC-type antimicrobial peptide transport system permease subunit